MIQCDRNLPVCNHCSLDEGTECNYTPKKRHKVPSDHGTTKDRPTMPYAAKTASFLISDMPSEERFSTGNWIAEHPEHNSKGKLPAGLYEMYSPGSQESYDDDESMDDDTNPGQSAIRSGYDKPWMADMPPVPGGSRSLSAGISGSRSCMFDGSLLPRRQLDAWYHPAFAPLPRAILQGMRTTNPAEMPTRQAFEDAFFQFLKELPLDLAEVSIFKPEAYIDISRAVASGDTSSLPHRVKFWTSFHHVSSGSRKYNLLILPREPYFNMGAENEERLRNDYIAEVDGDVSSSKVSGGSSAGPGSANPHEATQAFFRIPVVFQLYDILVY